MTTRPRNLRPVVRRLSDDRVMTLDDLAIEAVPAWADGLPADVPPAVAAKVAGAGRRIAAGERVSLIVPYTGADGRPKRLVVMDPASRRDSRLARAVPPDRPGAA